MEILIQKMYAVYMNAWNTSCLAYDGSGRVSRGSYLHNGVEKYHYSIGARYLIREIIKSLPETVGLEVLAKVPEAFQPYLT